MNLRLTQRTFMAGQNVGEWTLIEYRNGIYTGKKCTSEPAWKCQCSCGALRWVRSRNLKNGSSQGCGHAYQGAWKSKNLKLVNSVFALGGAL